MEKIGVIILIVIILLIWWSSESVVGLVALCVFELSFIGFVVYGFLVGIPKMKQQEIRALEEKRNKEKEREISEKELAYTEGLEKIAKMRPCDIEEYMKEIVRAKEELASTESLLKNRKMLYERKGDWAIAGGLAQGIAGPAAGVVAAQNVIRENQAIDLRNDNITSGLAQIQLYGLPKLKERVQELEKHIPEKVTIEELQKQYKVVLAWSPKTLFNKLNLRKKKCMRDKETNSIIVSTECTISKNFNFNIGGSLRAKLYTPDRKYVGCAYLNLPSTLCSNNSFYSNNVLTGIITEPNLHDTIFLRDVKEYEVRIEYVDLWVWVKKHNSSAKNRSDNLTDEEHRQIVAEHEAEFLKEQNKALGQKEYKMTL